MKIYPITPVAKPRMTQRDKWAKRPAVLKYRAFKDECKLRQVALAESFRVIFYIPMPESWSEKKKQRLDGTPCKAKPDIDNLCKALMDAVLPDDSAVWHIQAYKIYARQGAIGIELDETV